MGLKGKKTKRALFDFFDSLLGLEGVKSQEHYVLEDGSLLPLIQDLSLEVRRGESWAIYSRDELAVKVLLEIMGHMVPPAEGKRTYLEEAGKREKGQILDSLFYIGDSKMLPSNLNVLEALMFLTAKEGGDPVLRQEAIFDTLLDRGLGYLSLSYIQDQTAEERVLVSLMAGALGPSPLILMNLPHLNFDPLEKEILARLAELIREKNKGLAFATSDPCLAQTAASHTAFLHQGRQAFSGPVTELLDLYDRTLIQIEDEDPDRLLSDLAALFPDLQVQKEDGLVLIQEGQGEKPDPLALQKAMDKVGIHPQGLVIGHKSAKRAFLALEAAHDL